MLTGDTAVVQYDTCIVKAENASLAKSQLEDLFADQAYDDDILLILSIKPVNKYFEEVPKVQFYV